MKFHGIQLQEGSAVTNMTVASGTAFPSNPSEGELFFRSDAASTTKGLYAYIGGNWDRISSADAVTVPTGSALPGSANTGDVFYKNSNDGTEGMYVYNDSTWVGVSAPATGSSTAAGDLTGTIELGGTSTLTLATVATAGSAGTAAKTVTVTIDAKGRTTSLTEQDIAIAATQVTSGTFADARISSTSVAQHQGDLAIAATQVTSGTFADARVAQSNVTQHQAALQLAASQTVSGTFADARISQSSVVQHQAALAIAETQITDGSVLARVAGNETITGSWTFNGMTLAGHILPAADITYDLGSPSLMWRDLYVGPGSIYMNGKKILEDVSDTITFTTDLNQNLRIETTGTGSLELMTATGGAIIVKGALQITSGKRILDTAGVKIEFGDDIDMLSANKIINLATPTNANDAATKGYVDSRTTDDSTIVRTSGDQTVGGVKTFSGNLVVSGNLTVSGTTTTVNSETIMLADNIVELNSNFTTGTPTEDAGIQIRRGDFGVARFIWDETNDRFTMLDGQAVPASLSLYTGATITAGSFVGPLTGNASTATALQNARTINGVSFDGTANITVADSTKLPLTGGTLTGALEINHTSPTLRFVENDQVGGAGVWRFNAAGGALQLQRNTAAAGDFSTVSQTMSIAATDVITFAATPRVGSTNVSLENHNHDGTYATAAHTHSYLPLSGGTMTGTLSFPSGSAIRAYSTADTDITALVPGTTGGLLIEGQTNGHVVVTIDGNDSADSFNILAHTSTTGTGDNKAMETKLFSVRRDGAASFSGTVTAAGFSGPLTGNVTGSASLNVLKAGDTMTGSLVVSDAANVSSIITSSRGFVIRSSAAAGAWARGVWAQNGAGTTDLGGYGFLGNNETLTSFHVGFSSSWWTNNPKFSVLPTGAGTFAGTAAPMLTVERTDNTVNAEIAYTNTSGTVYAGHGAANTWAIGASANLTSSPWMTLTSSAAVFNTTVQGTNFHDGAGTYNVNLGRGTGEGRGLVAGYSGGWYGGIGYNVRHTGTSGNFIAPSADTASYLAFHSGGLRFFGAVAGTAGRTIDWSATTASFEITQAGAVNITGTVTAPTFSGALSGNATTATTLQTARTINGVSFNGSANISINLNNSLTFNNGGAGGASGSTFNGSGALTVSYNTVGAPSTTGTNASGTWGIAITGNAASSTLTVIQDTRAAQILPSGYTSNRAMFEFTNQITGLSDWHSAITMTGWTASTYGSWQIIGPSGTSPGENIYVRTGVGSTWNTTRTLLHSGNYNSYAPTLTGGGASGTWGINITGDAATLGGLAVNTSGVNNGVNQIVRTQGNGYTYFGWINTISGDNGTTTPTRIYASDDQFIRYMTPANFKSSLSLASTNVNNSWSANQTFSNYGLGIVGSYSSTRYQNVFSMGAAYIPAADGTALDNMYGIAWTHTNVGGQSKAGLSHQALFVTAGVTQTAIGTGIWTSGTVTAPIYAGSVSGSSYGSIRVDGTTGSYGGIYLASCSGTVAGMHDTSGNGGTYDSTTGWHFYWHRGNACLGIGGSTTASGYKAYVNGALYASGDITALSDKRVKDDVVTIENGLDKVNNLRGVMYTRNDNGDKEIGKRSMGVIAQEVEAVIPELVHTDEDTGMKAVHYQNMIAVLIEAVKELNAKVASLEAKLAEKE